jgi:hypothetical protein
MFSRVRKALVATAVTSTMVFGAAPMAAAQQQGLVNVQIGDITIQDINVGVAAQIVANACDLIDVGALNVAVLAEIRNVSRTGEDHTFCTADAGDVTVTQA